MFTDNSTIGHSSHPNDNRSNSRPLGRKILGPGTYTQEEGAEEVCARWRLSIMFYSKATIAAIKHVAELDVLYSFHMKTQYKA